MILIVQVNLLPIKDDMPLGMLVIEKLILA